MTPGRAISDHELLDFARALEDRVAHTLGFRECPDRTKQLY